MFNNKQQQTKQYFLMLPSNNALSSNIQSLLSRYKHESSVPDIIPLSVFVNPGSQQTYGLLSSISNKQKQLLNPQPKKTIIEQRIKLINNYSFKKIKSIEKKKYQLPSNNHSRSIVSRYNMSVDSTIELPQSLHHYHSKSRDSSIESLYQQKLVKRRGSTLYLIKSPKARHKLQAIKNGVIQLKDHLQLEMPMPIQQKKSFESKRKQWAASRAPITRRPSPRQDLSGLNFSILNNRNLQKPIPQLSKLKVQSQKQVRIRTITAEKVQEQKQNIITPIITTLKPKQHVKKSYTKTRHCKEMFFNRVLKSKTQNLKQTNYDEKISPWGEPASIRQQDSHLLYLEDY